MPKIVRYIFISLIAGNAFVYWAILAAVQAGPDLAIHFLDVGQGDAQLIRAKAGNVLIDGGPSGRVIYEIDKFLKYPDRTIDVVILTHPNLDHLAGLPEVLRRYGVRLFVMTGAEATLAEYQEIKRLIREKQIPVLWAVRGQKISLGGPSMTILWPAELLRHKNISRSKLNDTSIVARLSSGNFDALFTGDITADVERQIENLAGDIEVLKVAHHGSKYASDADFLKASRPEIAIIETGKNSYGHPTQEALDRLAAVGAKVLRTDVDGSISVVINNGVAKVVVKE